MSKAFIRESDEPELPDYAPPTLLPTGAKNYLTPGGAQQLRQELNALLENERPPLVAKSADGETKRQLHLLDQRIRYLEQSLGNAEVIERPSIPIDDVRFGATVTVRDQNDEVSTYRIVGVDEIDVERGYISWLSPIARALLSAKIGQRVVFKSPAGERCLDLLGISYE